jgi:transposase
VAILEDYTADVSTIKNLSTQWKNQFSFGDNEIILVFDRGMVSDENLKHLELNKYIYITAMDKNQIPKL